MAYLNKVILIGHLTADPELKTTKNQVSVCSFTIGVARRYKTGENTTTDFINCVAWEQNAEFICKYFRKGNAICVCGRIQTRNYEASDGTNRRAVEVIVDEATFVEKKANSEPTVEAVSPKYETVPSDAELPF